MPQDRWNEARGRGYAADDRDRLGYEEFGRRGDYDAGGRGRGEGRSFGAADDEFGYGGREGGGRYGQGRSEPYGGQWGRGEGGSGPGGWTYGTESHGREGGYRNQGYGGQRNQSYGNQGYGGRPSGDDAWSRGRGAQGYGGSDYGPRGGNDRGLPGGYAGQGGYGLSHDYDRGASQGYGSAYGDYDGSQRTGGAQGWRGDRDRGDHDRSWMERTGQKLGEFFGGKDRDHRGRGPKNYARSDDRIREDVNDRLTDDPWLDASEIDVQVKTCEVTLTGGVQSRDDKRRAEDLAEQVSGVRHVQNNLRVQAQTGAYSGAGSTAGASGAVDIGGMTGVTGTTASGGSAGSTAAGGSTGSTTSGGAKTN